MSEYKLRLVTLVNNQGESSPFRVYLKGEIPEGTTVRVADVTSVNPNTGAEREETRVSHGDSLVVSHDRVWFSNLSKGFINPEGFGFVQLFEDVYPSKDEVLASL